MSKKLIHGRWYKNSNWFSDTDFMKYDERFDSDYSTISGTERIYFGEYRNDSVKYWIDRQNCELADMKIVRKYLPKGHPDRRKQNINNRHD